MQTALDFGAGRMLFIEASFFAYLAVVLAVYLVALRLGYGTAALAWLGLASVVFYIWTDVRLLALLMFSVWVNFGFGWLIYGTRARFWVAAGIVFNVALLAVFKYADFAATTLNTLANAGIPLPHIALPLGISFFTFTQIAWLVDMRTKPKRPHPWDYLLFVTFFPHLIAGPILHHAEMMPQFQWIAKKGRKLYLSRILAHFSVGVALFSIGLFKKAVLADGCAAFSTPIFSAASQGDVPTTTAAWFAALAYTMQIYFDFSGYSDMAVGLARMFGIRLPMNFFSPYKSGNIIDFWRRWHMTLSRWLKDYIYIPLGGNRKGPSRRYINLMATMLIGGLWHGAAWSFVAWGALHGIYLIINHAWSRIGWRLGVFGGALTFFAVMNAWVLFKAGDFENDFRTAAAMFGAMYSWNIGDVPDSVAIVLAAAFIALLLPNAYQITHRYSPVLEAVSRPEQWSKILPARIVVSDWRPTTAWSIFAVALAASSAFVLTRASAYVEFIYFRF